MERFVCVFANVVKILCVITLNNINFTRLQFDRTSWSLIITYASSSCFLFSLSLTCTLHIRTHRHTHMLSLSHTCIVHLRVHTRALTHIHIHSRSRQFVLVSCAMLGSPTKRHEWELERTRLMIVNNNRPCDAFSSRLFASSTFIFSLFFSYARIACECIICARVVYDYRTIHKN